MLSEKVEHRSLDGRDSVNCGAKIESLLTAALRVSGTKFPSYGIEYAINGGNRLPDDQRPRFVERLAGAIATRHFAHTCPTGIVAQGNNIASEQRAMRPA
jgi:hypothetical protein